MEGRSGLGVQPLRAAGGFRAFGLGGRRGDQALSTI